MLELTVGTYGFLCWLLFVKLKLIPTNTYTIMSAILGGVVILLLLSIGLSICHPVSHDGRLYAPVAQIVPQVRGRVTEVPVQADTPVKAGDLLFRIDPRPFQIEVDRLRALLANKNTKVAQLNEQLAAAEAATREARSNLLVAESQFDRQAREVVEQSKSRLEQTNKRLELAKRHYERIRGLARTGAASAQEYEDAETRVLNLQEEASKAKAELNVAEEKLKSGSGSMQAVRDQIARAEADERQARLTLQAESDGVNPEVREVMAQLDRARWDLEQTEVRAPTDGYVPQVVVRPGQMAVPLPLAPMMVYVMREKPAFIATFAQNAVEGIEPGQEAELAFKAYPGRVFKARVKRVLSMIREGELDPSGQLLSGTPGTAKGDIPVLFEYDEDVEALSLPVGSQATVAVYTEKAHALSLFRKIVLRIKSWENYIFFFGH